MSGRYARAERRREFAGPPAGNDQRCDCGNLLARLVPNGVEILCRRCKRKHVIQWAEPAATAAEGGEREPCFE